MIPLQLSVTNWFTLKVMCVPETDNFIQQFSHHVEEDETSGA